jgi:hypothetical protein
MGKRKVRRERREAERAAEEERATRQRGYELKLSRAQHHLERCDRVISDWTKAADESVIEEPNPKDPGTHGAWIDPPPFPADDVSLIAGDSLQCFRTALDHLALELATANASPLPDGIEKRSEFPIFSDENGGGSSRFHERRSKGPKAGEPTPTSGLAKIAGMDPAAQASIERLQPYHRGEAFAEDPLWRLQELNRIDKHRVLHVIAAAVEGFSWTPMYSENVNLHLTKGFLGGVVGPVKGRTQVARWRSDTFEPIDPAKEMHVNFRPNLRIAFDAKTPLVGDQPVIDILREVEQHIVSSVVPPLVGYLK